MGLCTFPAWLVERTLDSGALCLQLLRFPELLLVGDRPARLKRMLLKEARRLLEETSPSELHTRWVPERLRTGVLDFTCDVKDTPASSLQSVDLKFHYAHWAISAKQHLATIPDLQIEVLGQNAEDLRTQLIKEARTALHRKGAALSLRQLLALQRTTELRVERVTLQAELKPPRQRAMAAGREQAQKPVLLDSGEDMRLRSCPEAFGLETQVKRLAEVLGSHPPRCVLLVGPSGVGKTALVNELVRRRFALGFGQTPFYATTGSRLVAGQCGYGMWQARCQRMVREASAEHAIVHLGALTELMEVGQSVHNSQSIAAFLRPFLESGELLAIAEALPEQISVIEERDPLLLQSFERIEMEEPSEAAALSILEQRGEAMARRRGHRWQPGALTETERLHRRYACYSAHPGRPLRFLEHLLADTPPETEIGTSSIIDAFSRQTGLPHFMLDDTLPLDLASTRRFFSERVLGQEEPVRLVVDLLATAKARLARPRRPLASLLFIGPTGVGKTELAKGLAAYLFGDPNRLTRFDMSEFSDPVAVNRLIAGTAGQREGLLTARIREQPFSVLLFDEFEKADPLFFDLLLQVLGEARLTDEQGRLADFSNAVIILTSNLGAQDFQRGRAGLDAASPGARTEARAAARHFEAAVQAFVRPELYNRFDRVIPFQPLGQDIILAICRRELERLRMRDGIRQRAVALSAPDEVIAWLAREGYDPLYGARPLQRAIEKQLLAPLSAAINTCPPEHALRASATVRDGTLQVQVNVQLDLAGRPVPAEAVLASEAAVARRALKLRRNLQRLDRSGEVLEITNELFRLESMVQRAAKRSAKKKMDRTHAMPPDFNADRYRELQAAIASLRGDLNRCIELEEDCVLQLYGLADLKPETAGAVSKLESNWRDLLLKIFALQFDEPHRVTVALFSERREFLFNLARAYLTQARERQYRVSCYRYLATGSSTEDAADVLPDHMRTRLEREDRENEARWRKALKDRPLTRELLSDPGAILGRADVPAIGLGFEFTGPMAFIRFCTEAGHHILAVQRKTYPCLVETSQVLLKDYLPPDGVERIGGLPGRLTRRNYILPLNVVSDPLLESLAEAASLPEVMERYLQQCAERLLK